MKVKSIVSAAILCVPLVLAAPSYSAAQINKEIVENTPQQERAPMPHLDPDNPDVIKLRDDPARDMWREKRDDSGPFNPPPAEKRTVSELVFSHVPSRDFNADAKVDFVDFAIISSFRGLTNCADSNWCKGTDLDRDGDVDTYDLILFADYWLETSQ